MDTRGGSMEEFGDTPVALTLEVARFELPLGDVAALGVGEVVRSGVPLDGRVTLRAGNRAIATGELVSIDGELGVRITALA